MAKVTITKDLLERAMGTDAVRQALAQRARLVHPRAVRAAADAGALEFAKRLRVEEGVRPGTKSPDGIRRPYARVIADMPEDARKADARSRRSRRSILRGSAR